LKVLVLRIFYGTRTRVHFLKAVLVLEFFFTVLVLVLVLEG